MKLITNILSIIIFLGGWIGFRLIILVSGKYDNRRGVLWDINRVKYLR